MYCINSAQNIYSMKFDCLPNNVLTSNGFKLKYVAPGRFSLSICCLDVRTESLCSIAFTYKTSIIGLGHSLISYSHTYMYNAKSGVGMGREGTSLLHMCRWGFESPPRENFEKMKQNYAIWPDQAFYRGLNSSEINKKICLQNIENDKEKTGVFLNHKCPQWQKSPKFTIFSIEP